MFWAKVIKIRIFPIVITEAQDKRVESLLTTLHFRIIIQILPDQSCQRMI